VVVRNGLIEAVGENVQVPADAWVVDGEGMTVYPGLIDALSTVGMPAPRQRLRLLAAAAAGDEMRRKPRPLPQRLPRRARTVPRTGRRPPVGCCGG